MIQSTAAHMPQDEMNLVTETYKSARVILEYGSGGTTRIAAQMPGKLIFSVETDPVWAMELQRELDEAETASPVTVYHSDIGETGKWGRPILTEESWRSFHRSVLDIWQEPFFRPPDVVLIDGRMRMACLAAVILCTDKPVTVLFDDYVDRPMYQLVENVIKPVDLTGRMARFEIQPDMVEKSDVGYLISLFSTMSVSGYTVAFYDEKVLPWLRANVAGNKKQKEV